MDQSDRSVHALLSLILSVSMEFKGYRPTYDGEVTVWSTIIVDDSSDVAHMPLLSSLTW